MKRHRTKTSPPVPSSRSISPARGSAAWRRCARLPAAWHGKPLLDDASRFMITPEQRSWNGLARLWIQTRTTWQHHPLVDTPSPSPREISLFDAARPYHEAARSAPPALIERP